MSEVTFSASSSYPPPPAHGDAPWVNGPILFTSGPLRGRWIRAHLTVQQQPRRGRKGALHDLRPLHPPPTVRLRLWEVLHPVPPATIIPDSSPDTLQFSTLPSYPPRDAQELPIAITPKLTTHFLCFASLFRVHPPTREEEYKRVDRKVMIMVPEGASNASHYQSRVAAEEVLERPKSDKSRLWKALRPHPMTAISSQDPHWSASVSEAWRLFNEEEKLDSPILSDAESNQDGPKDVETVEGDLSFRDMVALEKFLPREPPKWVIPYRDVTSQLSKRETAGHLIPSNDSGEPALYFVFSDLAIKSEGYFALRFHVVNLDWRVDSRFCHPGIGFFSPLADCVTDAFAVYSTKEFPGLPPTTEFTTYLVRSGVRIRFRDDRVVDAAAGEPKGRSEARQRMQKRKGVKSSPPDLSQMRLDMSPPQLRPLGLDGTQDDTHSKRESILEQANLAWKGSPSGGLYEATFEGPPPSPSLRGSTSSYRGRRSSTVSSIRGPASPHLSHVHDRRSFSNSHIFPPANEHGQPYRQPSQPGLVTLHRGAAPQPQHMLTMGPTVEYQGHIHDSFYAQHVDQQRWSISPISPSSMSGAVPWHDEQQSQGEYLDQSSSTTGTSFRQQGLMMRERVHRRFAPYQLSPTGLQPPQTQVAYHTHDPHQHPRHDPNAYVDMTGLPPSYMRGDQE